MGATTVMAVIMIVWCAVTLAVHPEKAKLPTPMPDLSRADQPGSPKIDAEGKPILDAMGDPLDPLGFIGRTALGDALRPGHDQLAEPASACSASSSPSATRSWR